MLRHALAPTATGKANSMEYYYIDRLPGENMYGEADTHFHPLEPFSGRLTIAKQF
jgi:hypothetical protein